MRILHEVSSSVIKNTYKVFTKLLFNNTLLYSNNNELYQNIANNKPGVKTLTFVYNKSNSKESMEWNKYIEKKLNLYQGTISSNKYTYDNY